MLTGAVGRTLGLACGLHRLLIARPRRERASSARLPAMRLMWITAAVMRAAAGGRNQPFYHVLVDMRNRPCQVRGSLAREGHSVTNWL